jgi:membrane protease subunit HflC
MVVVPMRKILLLVTAGLIVLFTGTSAAYSVDRTEFAYVTQFGQPIAIYDGETDAGLHFKLPWPMQAVQRLDRRLQVFDLPGTELLTHDPKGNTIDKTLTISAYVCWRIAPGEGVGRFLRSVGTPERAEAVLGQRITSRLGAEIGKMQLEDLISVAADNKQVEERMDRLSQRLRDQGNPDDPSPTGSQSLHDSARDSYGIELVDIRVRRFNYPAQVREAIFDRIRSERSLKVANYQSLGMQRAEAIRSQAEFEARTTLAQARAAEQIRKGQAEAEADQIRNQAHKKDAEFYTFLKKLAEYQRILGDNKTVLLLSSHYEWFDLLFKPPSPEGAPMKKPAGKPASAKTGGS